MNLTTKWCRFGLVMFGISWSSFGFGANEGSGVRLSIRSGMITGLKWEQSGLALKHSKGPKGVDQFYVTLHGTFSKPNAELTSSTRKLVSTLLKVPQKFSIRVPITRELSLLRIRAVDVHGKVEKIDLLIKVYDFESQKEKLLKGRLFVSASLGYTLIQYQEAGVINFAMSAITTKASLLYKILPGRWDMAVSAYFTALQLTPGIGEESQFLGVNVRIGYTFPFIQKPWQLSLLGGFYYTTMIVANSDFGFNNLMGPQLFPMLRYEINSKSSVGVYAKFSPIVSELGSISFSQSEIAGGIGYTRLLSSNHPVSVNLDISSLNITVSGNPISTQTTSFSIGYGF